MGVSSGGSLYVEVGFCLFHLPTKDQRCTMLVECAFVFLEHKIHKAALGFCASNSIRNGLLLLRFSSLNGVHPVLGRKNHSEANALCDDFYFEMFEVLGGSEKLKRNAATKMAGDPVTHLLPSSFQNKSLWLPLGCPIHLDWLIETTNKKRKDSKTCSAAGHWMAESVWLGKDHSNNDHTKNH